MLSSDGTNEFTVTQLLQVLFWLSVGLVLYVYAGYPALLYLFTRKRNRIASSAGGTTPRVTLLISAYNEKAVITEKLHNSLALEYPRDCIEIIVISDCSDDGTDDAVLNFSARGVRLVRQTERLGKSAGLNLGVPQATGEILIFSDANSMYDSQAIGKLVRHFSDPRVGYVVGNCAYAGIAGQPPSAESEGLYWKLETWLKEKESDFGSVVGGDGAIYAIRRDLFTPLQATDINDFLNPLQIILWGFRGVYDRSAVCYEEAGDSFRKEFRRKVRIVSRSLNAVRRVAKVLLPWNQPRHWLALVSHKVLRWFVPVFSFIALFTSVLLWGVPFYRLIALLQVSFYVLAVCGLAMQASKATPKVFYLPYYFCLVNVASLLGVIKFLRGSLSPTWQTIRQETPAQQVSRPHLAGKGS